MRASQPARSAQFASAHTRHSMQRDIHTHKARPSTSVQCSGFAGALQPVLPHRHVHAHSRSSLTPEVDCEDDKSVLCKFIQIIGDCVFLSYSPKPVSNVVGCAISFTCCLSAAPRGAQKYGTETLMKASMNTDLRAEIIVSAKSCPILSQI